MSFEWDEQKERANIAKHGIAFVEAAMIFRLQHIAFPDLRKNYGETRFNALGLAQGKY